MGRSERVVLQQFMETVTGIPEGTHTSAARVVLKQYIAGARCPQPHQDIKRLCDGTFRTLVLFSMSTRRIDVFDMVNEKIRLLGPGNKISRAAFYRLWCEEFIHVKIPPYSRFSKVPHMLGVPKLD